MNNYRRVAAISSVLTHLLLLLGLRLLLWRSPAPEHAADVVYLQMKPAPSTRIEHVPRRKEQQAGWQRAANVQPPKELFSEQVIVPRDSLAMGEVLRESGVVVERQFFGDTLYSILQKYPQLKPVVLQQMLARGVEAYDSLATLRQQIAQALAPYIEMSDAERAARANMKRFGYARNPHHVQAIPDNIPISAIVMYLIQLLTQ